MNLSYTTFSNIQCPIKFYIIKTLCSGKKRPIKADIGICVHEIYKTAINDLIQTNQISFDFGPSLVQTKFPRLNFNRLAFHINKYLLYKMQKYLQNGYNVKIEKSNGISTEYKIFNEYLKLFTKPDISCIRDNCIHIIDIKTGVSDDIDQLIYYLWSAACRNERLTEFKGFIYNTRQNKLLRRVSYTRSEILEIVHNKITTLREFHRKYNINSFADFATFIDTSNIKSEVLLRDLTETIKDVSCNTCKFKSICPAYSEYQGSWFEKLNQSKSFSEKILHLVSSLSAESSRKIYAKL